MKNQISGITKKLGVVAAYALALILTTRLRLRVPYTLPDP
jgi:hypothetical protein